MRLISLAVKDETANYIEDLAEQLAQPDMVVAQLLLEKAVEIHKKGRFEL